MTAPSTFTREDALTILEMADVCFSESTGPDFNPMLKRIEEQHPDLIENFDYLPIFQE